VTGEQIVDRMDAHLQKKFPTLVLLVLSAAHGVSKIQLKIVSSRKTGDAVLK
jgi:hypothetical protein